MFKNYLKITLRNMRRQKVYSFINISGLALSIACCLVILMHIRFESSYDTFQKDADRIYRIGIDIDTPSFKRTFAPISYFMAPYLKEYYPQVEEAARFRRTSTVLVQRGERVFYEDNFIQADNDIFKVLTFPFKIGDPDTALIQAGTLVISESMADKYFGRQDSLGQTILVNSKEYVITGIIADPPKNTHLKFHLIASMLPNEVPASSRRHWNTNGFFTYVKFRPGTDLKKLLPQIEAGANKNRDTSQGQKFTYFLQPLKDIHLHSHISGELEPPGNPTYLLIFGLIAGFILIIASINFINLSTARAAARAKEVGMRKIVGAFRSQLIFQFLGESLLTTLLAVVLACVFVAVFFPFYRGLTDISYTLKDLFRFDLLMALTGIFLFSGLFAGSYPAFFLSAFRPIAILRGKQGGRSRGNGLRRILVVVQFTVSLILISGTIVVAKQLRYMKNASLGFEKAQKVIIPVRQGASISENFDTVKAEFQKYPSITGITVSSGVPGRLGEGAHVELVGEPQDMGQWMYYLFVDADFLKEYGMELYAGRAFQRERVVDSGLAYMINETAVRKFGWSEPSEAVGKTIHTGYYRGTETKIIGVVKDFHFFGLQQEIGPLLITIMPRYFRYITLTLSTENMGQTLSSVKKTWEGFFPGIPFDYFFLDSYFDRLYREEEKVSVLVRVFSILAISIACLGILGLTAHTTQRRTKEIGIRKVIGASTTRIAALLTGEFVKWIVFANLFALPTAYYILNRWLSGFAYRTPFSVWFLLIPSFLTLVLAALTVSYHTGKAATANPADSLRYE